MRATNRKLQTEVAPPSQLFVLPPATPKRLRLELRPDFEPLPEREPPPPPLSFHATLKESVQAEAKRRSSPWSVRFPFRLPEGEPQRPTGSVLTRVWMWLHARYALSATKRLRVAETVSLGEKRFVSLVSVGRREFLIGGGASGVSLLAQLGAGSEVEGGTLAEFGLDGDLE
jgi:hypothetical protein